MKLYSSWMIKDDMLVCADSKTAAAKLLVEMTKNRIGACKKSVQEAGIIDILRCKHIIRDSFITCKKYTIHSWINNQWDVKSF